MPRTVIACYRPKPGADAALHELARTHFSRLYLQGLVTRRRPFIMQARDGTLVEVFEWKSQRAIDEAHDNPAVMQMWAEYAEVCDYVPVGQLEEASELFSGFESPSIAPVIPPLSKVYNQVQVNERIATSGTLTADTLTQIADAGYRRIIDLLPSTNRYALPGERKLAEGHGLAYDNVPVDFAAPRRADFAAFTQAMDAAANDKVWVHCAANLRVTVFMSLYGQLRMGWGRERAAELIAEVWEPDEIWQTFLRDNAP